MTKTVDGVASVTQQDTVTRRQTVTYTVTEDQLATQSNEVTAYVTEVVTTVIVVDVTQTATQYEDQTAVLTETNTAFITDTQTVDLDLSTTVTQTEDVTTTATERTTETATKVNTVDATDYETILQTSSTTITVTQPATLYTTITSTVDVTSTEHVTKTVDVTVTQTISTTTTKVVTATTTQTPVPTCGGPNKISNGEFDTYTLAPWTFQAYGAAAQGYGVPGYNSPVCLALYTNQGTSSSSAVIRQSFPTVPGHNMFVGFRYWSDISNTAPSSLRCEVNIPGSSFFSTPLNVNKNAWFSVGFSFTAPSSSTILICSVSSAGSITVYLDAFISNCV